MDRRYYISYFPKCSAELFVQTEFVDIGDDTFPVDAPSADEKTSEDRDVHIVDTCYVSHCLSIFAWWNL